MMLVAQTGKYLYGLYSSIFCSYFFQLCYVQQACQTRVQHVVHSNVAICCVEMALCAFTARPE